MYDDDDEVGPESKEIFTLPVQSVPGRPLIPPGRVRARLLCDDEDAAALEEAIRYRELPMTLRSRYAISDTDVDYRATQLLRDVRY
eukprot:2077296-Rhodomonas_salina.1